MFNKKRIFIFVVFLILLFFLMTFGGYNGENLVATRLVKFIDGINNEVISAQTVEVGHDAKEASAPKHRNYVFVGWFDDTKKVTIFTNILKDLTVTGEYKRDINNNGIDDDTDSYFTVTFYDPVSKSNIKRENVLIGMNATAPAAPTHNGYTFDGWDKGYTNVRSNLTVNAVYSKETLAVANLYKITFIDKLTNKVIDTQTVKEGLTASIPTAPTHKYYIFDKWTGNYSNVQKDETVYANYIDVEKYTVTFVSGEHGLLNTDQKEVMFKDIKEGMNFKEGSITAPTVNPEEGYTFTNWDNAFTDNTLVDNNQTYTALYEANKDTNYKVEYYKDNKLVATDNKVGTTDKTITLDKEELSTKFKGYQLNESPSELKGTIKGDGSLVLKVYYQSIVYIITYNSNDNGVTNASATPTDKAFTINDTPVNINETMTSDSHEFTGWYTKPVDGTKVSLVNELGDITLYAHWTKKNFNVVVDPNGGNIPVDPTDDEYEYGDEITLPASTKKYTLTFKEDNKTDDTKEASFEFLGWCSKNTCTTSELVTGKVTVTKDVTYKAVYSTSPAPLTIKDGEDYQTATTDYTFTKWVLDKNTLQYTKTDYVKDDTITLLGDTVLNATYSESARKYNLTINYKYSDETKAAESINSGVANGNAYNVTSPKITGYTANKPTVSGTMPTNDVEINVVYSINNYNLIYDLNTPNNIVNASSKPANIPFNILTDTFNVDATVTSSSHNFIGWYTSPTGGEEVLTVNKGTNNNITVYAHWSVKQINTKFDPNGGTIDETKKDVVNEYGDEITLPTVTNNYTLNYVKEINTNDGNITKYATLLGWCKNDKTCDQSSSAFIPYTTTKTTTTDNAVYYAVWGTANEAIVIKTGLNYQTDTTDYTFTKWSLLNNTLGYDVTDYVKDDTITLLGDTTLKAMYESVARKYNLTINYNYVDTTVAHEPHNSSVANGSTYNITSPVIPGYLADRLNITGAMPTNNVTENVVYSPRNDTPYKVLFYKDGKLQNNDTLQLSGTTNSLATYTPNNNKYDNYKLGEGSIISANINADGTTELKVFYVEKKAHINVTITKTLNKGDSSFPSNALAYNDTITYKVVINNTGEGRGTINVKDALIAEGIINGVITVVSPTSISNEIFSNIGHDFTLEGNTNTTFTVTIKVTGKAGDSFSSKLEPIETSTDTYKIETNVTVLEIGGKGSNVVLVLDNSASIKKSGNLDNLKNAAKSFIKSVLGDDKNPNNRACVVIMPDEYYDTAKYSCSNSNGTLMSFIDSNIDGSGWTPYTPALEGAVTAKNELSASYPKNDNYTIFLTDGEPIYYGYETHYHETVYYYDYNYADAVTSLKNNGTVYTIGYNTNTASNNLLAGIASTGKNYTASNDNLNKVFNDISKSISSQNRVTTSGRLNISSKIDQTKNLTIKETKVNNQTTTLTKNFVYLLTNGYIVKDEDNYKLDASKFEAGSKIVLTYYTK